MLLKQKRHKGFVIGRIATLLMVLAAFAATNSAKAVALGSGGGVDKSRSAEVSDDDAFSGIDPIGAYRIEVGAPFHGLDNYKEVDAYGVTQREFRARPTLEQQIVADIYRAFQVQEGESVKIGRNKPLASMLDFIKSVWNAFQWRDGEAGKVFKKLYEDVQKSGGSLGVVIDMNGPILAADRRSSPVRPYSVDVGLQVALWEGGDRFDPINVYTFSSGNAERVDLYGVMQKTNPYDISPRQFYKYLVVRNEDGEVERVFKETIVLAVDDNWVFSLQQQGVEELRPYDSEFERIEKLFDNVDN